MTGLIPVVAVALVGDDGRVLLHRRGEGKHHALLWEFPGGKVDPGENAQEAIIREAREELGITLTEEGLHPVTFAQGRDQPHLILLYAATRWDGVPVALEWPGDGRDGVGWFTRAHMAAKARGGDMPPLDVVLLQGLGVWLDARSVDK